MKREGPLDRTLSLLGGDLFPTLPHRVIEDALTGSAIAIAADRGNLENAAAQTAVLCALSCIARCGIAVHLELADVPIAGEQPPLRGKRLLPALLELGRELPGPLTTAAAPAGTPSVLLGCTPARGRGPTMRMGGGDWHGEVRFGAEVEVSPFEGRLPFGGLLAGIAVAAEAVRIVAAEIRDLHGVVVPGEFDLAQPREVRVELPALQVPDQIELGDVDLVSAGAITNGFLFTVLRLAASGTMRVIDADHAELANLNRYLLLCRAELGATKVDLLERFSRPGLEIRGLARRFDPEGRLAIGALAPAVICGVDDIPSRWFVQEQQPKWLCVGGTSHFTVLVSEHGAGMPCAGCLHPEDDLDAPAELPTIAFTSLLAGVIQAHRLLAHVLGERPRPPLLAASFHLSGPYALEQIGLHPRDTCPVGFNGCAESQRFRAVERRAA